MYLLLSFCHLVFIYNSYQTWISSIIYHGLLYVEWYEVKGNSSFIWYRWNFWPSLFKLSLFIYWWNCWPSV